MSRVASLPVIVFTTPRKLPDAKLRGRVAVLDIAFAADGMGTPFEKTTGPFIAALGGRLAAWVDHHDHDRHADFAAIALRARHQGPARRLPRDGHARGGARGRPDRHASSRHVDLDGLYAAAKWILGGASPIPAPTTTRAPSTRASARRARPAR